MRRAAFVIAIGLAACGGAPHRSTATTSPDAPAAACRAARTGVGEAARTHDVAASDRIARASAVAARGGGPSCRAALGHDLGELARRWHRDGVARGDAAALEAALRLYRAALEVAPDAPDAGDTGFYTAELLWTRAERAGAVTQKTAWREIAETYDRALAHGVPIANRKEAAYAALLAWRNAVGDLDEAAHTDGPRDYTDEEAKLVGAARRYLALDPDRAPAVVFLAGRLAWRAGRWDEAVPLFDELIERAAVDAPPPELDEIAGYAASLLLDSLASAQRDVELRVAIDRLRGRTAFLAHHPDVAAIVLDVSLQLDRKEAERREAIRDFRGCAEQYQAILRDHPDAERADELAWNEAVCWSRAGERERAADAYREVIRRTPDSPLAARARAELAGQASPTTP